MESWAQGLAEVFNIWSVVYIAFFWACGALTVRCISSSWEQSL
jgi:hypothetical protein